MKLDAEHPKAVLLVGGMGTRLRSLVSSVPKPLASVGDRSFLELILRQLRSQGIRRVVMCSGYMADQIEQAFRDGHDFGIEIEHSVESHPLGTAGALKLASPYLDHVPDFLVLNGDSFTELDFGKLVHFHRQHKAVATIAVRQVEDAARYGTVQVAPSGRVDRFVEKAGIQSPGLINAGIYMFDRSVLDRIPEGTSSLERDVFPSLLQDALYAEEQFGMFIDIGTPEDYMKAQALGDVLRDVAARPSSSSSTLLKRNS